MCPRIQTDVHQLFIAQRGEPIRTVDFPVSGAIAQMEQIAGSAIEADAPFLVTPGRSQPSDFVLRR